MQKAPGELPQLMLCAAQVSFSYTILPALQIWEEKKDRYFYTTKFYGYFRIAIDF